MNVHLTSILVILMPLAQIPMEAFRALAKLDLVEMERDALVIKVHRMYDMLN